MILCPICNKETVTKYSTAAVCQDSYHYHFYEIDLNYSQKSSFKSHERLYTQKYYLRIYDDAILLTHCKSSKDLYINIPNFKIKPKYIELENLLKDIEKLSIFI